jgi:hypothetical protein
MLVDINGVTEESNEWKDQGWLVWFQYWFKAEYNRRDSITVWNKVQESVEEHSRESGRVDGERTRL